METKSYHHGDLKAELIKKGLEILNSKGYEGLSLRSVASACGVSQTAPYRHFKNKDELVSEIFTQALRAFNESLLNAAGKHPDNPKDQIREMGVAYVRFFVENPEYLRVLFLSDISLASVESLCGKQAHLTTGHPFATFFNAVKMYKESTPEDTRDLNELLVYCWGLVHGISVLASRHEIPELYDVPTLVSHIVWNERFL